MSYFKRGLKKCYRKPPGFSKFSPIDEQKQNTCWFWQGQREVKKIKWLCPRRRHDLGWAFAGIWLKRERQCHTQWEPSTSLSGDQGTISQGVSEAEGGGAEQEGERSEWSPGKQRPMIQAANEVLVYGRSKAEAPEKEKRETLPSWFAILQKHNSKTGLFSFQRRSNSCLLQMSDVLFGIL